MMIVNVISLLCRKHSGKVADTICVIPASAVTPCGNEHFFVRGTFAAHNRFEIFCTYLFGMPYLLNLRTIFMYTFVCRCFNEDFFLCTFVSK